MTTEPTCTEQGEKTRKCSRCDYFETEPVDALGHDYQVFQVIEPTCTEGGKTIFKCSRCEDSYEDNYTDALGHDMGEWTVTTEPTCTEQGEKTRECSRCDYFETEPVDALGHDYQVFQVIEPTCTEGGKTIFKCSRCEDSYEDNYTDALGHDMGEWTVTTEPTCTEQGEKTRECSRCDYFETEPVDALGHDYQIFQVIEPTCTEGGKTIFKCSRCEDSYEGNYTEALGHDMGEWTVTTPATCTEDGVETRSCARCGETETRVIEHSGHQPGEPVQENYQAPTAAEDGGYDTVVYCLRCGAELDRQHTLLPATGPELSDGFYLIGPDWSANDLDGADRFTENGESQGEYLLHTSLEAGERFKVVKLENRAITAWYPEGEGNEYVVDPAHSGIAVIYFRESWNEAWASFGGYFYVEHIHSWTVRGDKIVCEHCGQEMQLNDGLFGLNGSVYYALNGSLQSGWQQIEGDWYYFDETSMAGMNGSWKNSSKVTFRFENGKLLSGVWQLTNNHYRYWFGPDYYKKTEGTPKYLEQEIDGDLYLFNVYGYRAEGVTFNKNAEGTLLKWFDCGADGKAVRLSGPQILEHEGKLYYLNENGETVPDLGLILFEEYYYYAVYDGSLKRNGDRAVTEEKANGLLPAGTYHFDENGRMTNPPEPQPADGVGSDGYYRENGEIVPDKGLIFFEGYYYYVIYNGQIKRNGERAVTEDKTNGLLPAGKYYFDENGHMTNVPVLDGIDEDGYYRENGVIVKDKGLVFVEGYYYYVIYNGKIKKNGDRVVTEDKTNGLLPAGTYHFGEDGRMTNVPVEFGIDADGYYRENFEIVKDAGMVCVNGKLYYVLYNGKVKKNDYRVVTADKANGLVAPGKYYFGADGALCDPPDNG